MQRFHAGGDIYITMSNGTTVGHVGPEEDMTTVCTQKEADTRIILHIIHALNCEFSSILIKTSDSDVIVILIHHLHHFDTISTGATSRGITGSGRHSESSTSDDLQVLWEFNAVRLSPLFVTLTGCDSTSAMKGRSKIMCFSAWKKCSPRVTQCMVEQLESPFQHLQMDAKFDALEELFIQLFIRRVGLIDQPSAENDFLSEKLECWNDPPPITEFPILTLSAGNAPGKCMDDGPWLSYDRIWSVSSWLEQRTRSPHSWVNNNPWSCCNVQRTGQMWMQKNHVQVSADA